MGGAFLRGLAFLLLVSLVALTACQASITGMTVPTSDPAPLTDGGLRT